MKNVEEIKTAIHEMFAESTDIVEVAETYAEIIGEARIQIKYMAHRMNSGDDAEL